MWRINKIFSKFRLKKLRKFIFIYVIYKYKNFGNLSIIYNLGAEINEEKKDIEVLKKKKKIKNKILKIKNEKLKF